MGLEKKRTPMSSTTSVLIGRGVRALSHLRGGGSALPGMVVERIDPGFLQRTLNQLPFGVVVISGTNGKTTTTRMVSSVLEALGLKVFTNKTGSNFVRGVISSLLQEVNAKGFLDADIAVLELDEAHAVHFVEQVKPRYCLLLNVLRDQLDRFGEIDTTAGFLAKIVQATTGTVVLNREDQLIAQLSQDVAPNTSIAWYGLNAQLRSLFPEDSELHKCTLNMPVFSAEDSRSANNPNNNEDSSGVDKTANMTHNEPHNELNTHGDNAYENIKPLVILDSINDDEIQFCVRTQHFTTKLKVPGVYNFYNAAAALALIISIMDDIQGKCQPQNMSQNTLGVNTKNLSHDSNLTSSRFKRVSTISVAKIIEALSNVTPAFGRGETIDIDGVSIELILVKNPAGFNLALRSCDLKDCLTMIAINDEYADGRDVSWLWDVDVSPLESEILEDEMLQQNSHESGGSKEGSDTEGPTISESDRSIVLSGSRCWDMALRLQYAQIPCGYTVSDVAGATQYLLEVAGQAAHRSSRVVHCRVFCTYTAMLSIRKYLGTVIDIPDIGVGTR